MGKVKFRTRNPYIGHRRNPKRRTKLKLGIEKLASQDQDGKPPAEATLESASARKCSLLGVNPNLNNTIEKSEDSDCFIIAHKSSLSKFFNCLSCPECFQKTIHFDLETSKFSGSTAYGILRCEDCSKVIHEGFLSNRLGGEHDS